jgi:hypothetical protein
MDPAESATILALPMIVGLADVEIDDASKIAEDELTGAA